MTQPNEEKAQKRSTSIRLTPEALRLISEMQQQTGINQSGIVELAIRELAKARGVQ